MPDLNLTPTLTITRTEYRNLLRDSLQLEAVKAYLESSEYTARRELLMILNMKEKKTNEYDIS